MNLCELSEIVSLLPPLFIFDQRYTVESAQPLGPLARLLDQLRAEDAPRWRSQMPP